MRNALAAVIAMAAAVTTASAQPALVTHNGSLMEIILDPSTNVVSIIYVNVKPALAPIVPNGTVLVVGKWISAGHFDGWAKLFSSGPCTSLLYHVEGGIDANGSLVLEGPAPIEANPLTCRPTVYGWTHNSVLKFDKLPDLPMAQGR